MPYNNTSEPTSFAAAKRERLDVVEKLAMFNRLFLSGVLMRQSGVPQGNECRACAKGISKDEVIAVPESQTVPT